MKRFLIILAILISIMANRAMSGNEYFIKNQGQWPWEVQFMAKTDNMNIWITRSGITYDFYKLDYVDSMRNGQVVKMQFLPCEGADDPYPYPNASGVFKAESKAGYYIGSDTSKWAADVQIYEEVLIENIYKGISAWVYFDKGQFRYDFVVNEGADPNKIKMKYQGYDMLGVSNDNELVINTKFGEVLHRNLIAYQKNGRKWKDVECEFNVSHNGEVSFELNDYDNSLPLIIDPMVYSTFIGGFEVDMGIDIAIDEQENIYITGQTGSNDYPTTAGQYNQTIGSGDIFVTKLSPDGRIIYSLIIGGTKFDISSGIEVDESGNAYVVGLTFSEDFPTTFNCYDDSFNGLSDGVIIKINSTGSVLQYSSYFGGNKSDNITMIGLDEERNCYIGGYTSSIDFPVSEDAFHAELINQSTDVFISKVSLDGASIGDLKYSTYFGGYSNDFAHSGCFENGTVYMTGYTDSYDFPLTENAISNEYKSTDGFVFGFKTDEPKESALVYSSYFGGNNFDQGSGISVNDNKIYLTGQTSSIEFVTTDDSYDEGFNGGEKDGFILVINPELPGYEGIHYSTFIGGSGDDHGNAIDIDDNGNIFISGATSSTDFPITEKAEYPHLTGSNDAFITMISPGHMKEHDLAYSTYLGGTFDDEAYGIKLKTIDRPVIVGITSSANFPVTTSALQNEIGGNADVFIAELNVGVTDIEIDLAQDRKIKVYPNPTNKYLNIEFDSYEHEKVEIILSDILGIKQYSKLVDGYSGQYKEEINITKLQSGVYFLRLKFGDKVWGEKIVIKR